MLTGKIAPLASHCANHPERVASALCVDCRRSICQECATQWDGINYCVACIARKRGATAARGSWIAWLGVTALLLISFFLAIQVMLVVGGFITGLS